MGRFALLVSYGFHNLSLRSVRSLLTTLGIALVVGVFCYLLCLAAGLRRALARTGDPRNLIVLAEAATAEGNSALSHEDVQRLGGLPQAARDADQRPLVSPEYVVQTSVARRGDRSGASASVTVRGVEADVALAVHGDVALVEGRWFRPGASELVVGRTAARQYEHAAPGSTIECGNRMFTIVGVFSARGAHEGELWGHGPDVADACRRAQYSCAALRLASSNDSAEAQKRIAAAAIALRAVPEPAYFAGQAHSARVLEGLALALVAIMGAAAVFSAMNTMHAAVTGRTREIGVLRAIGYSRGSVLLGVLAESLALALLGGALGCLACGAALLLDRDTRDLAAGATFTSVAYRVEFSAASVAWSMGVAALIGLLGGLWPARSASRLPVVQALRAE